MEMNKELNFIISKKYIEKRTEKSKYFTEEFFKKCGIKKYRYVLHPKSWTQDWRCSFYE